MAVLDFAAIDRCRGVWARHPRPHAVLTQAVFCVEESAGHDPTRWLGQEVFKMSRLRSGRVKYLSNSRVGSGRVNIFSNLADRVRSGQ